LLLVALSIGWICLRASVHGDAAPVVADPGFRHGLSVNPLGQPRDSLRKSDVVVTINRMPVDAWLGGGSTSTKRVLTYGVRRDGHLTTVAVPAIRQEVTSERLRVDGGSLLCAIAILGLGGYVVYRRRNAAAARSLLLLGAGLAAYAAIVTFGYDTSDLVDHRAVFDLGFIGSMTTLILWTMAASYLALTFPQPSRFVVRHRRVLLGGYAAILAGMTAAAAVIVLPENATLARLDAITSVNGGVLTVLALLTVTGLGHSLWRAWREPPLRSQCLVVVLGFTATAVGLLIANLVAGDKNWPAWLDMVLLLPLPLGVTAAILRGEFLGIRAVVNRTLVYTALTGALLAVYAGAVTAVGALLGHAGVGRELVATAAVAIAFAPLRTSLQRGVDKLLYGARGDRAHALRTVAQRLEAASDPGDVLPAIAAGVAGALNLPYVAVRTRTADGSRLAAERGERTDELQIVPLVHHGGVIGELAVSARQGEKTLGARDLSLLGDIARQVAPAVRAARLVTDLAASHHQLAVTREEERAQLRHDLHDRLGPHLVGLSLQLDVLSTRLEDPDGTIAVSRAHEQASLALDEVRRISRGLRPAELEDLGLIQAIEAAASRLSIADGVPAWSVCVDAAIQLGQIPVDVEAAAYQIALEGLTNAYRHSHGSAAVVRVGIDAVGRSLIVEVTDNGDGINASSTPGVGIGSMHARAESVGGGVSIGRSPTGGTAVRASLPLDGR
jgi:signal transduction histidine kinase